MFEWTTEAVERARKMRLDGASATKIAAMLGGGLTRNAVIGKLSRDGIPAPRSQSRQRGSGPITWTQQMIEDLRAMAARRATQAELRGHFGFSIEAIQLAANRHDIELPDRRAACAAASKSLNSMRRAMARRQDDAQVTEPPHRSRPEIAAIVSKRVSILEIEPGVCRWPLGDPLTSDFAYCGNHFDATGDLLRPYCDAHRRVAHEPPVSVRAA